MVCKMCKERGKTWEGDDPICFFDGDDNWNCATLGAIRGICEKAGHRLIYRGYFEDDHFCHIDISEIFHDSLVFSLWVKWYKRRGRTDYCLIFDDDGPRKPTENELLYIIAAFDEGI